MSRGKLIIIDGLDGAGKTSQAKLLFTYLKKLRKKIILTQEPDDKLLIQLIKNNREPLADLFLFLADRSLHYQKIVSLLNHGYFIVSDRSFPATFAYQYYASGLRAIINSKLFLAWEEISRLKINPDLVLILDIKPKTSLERLKLKSKHSSINKFEKIKFLAKVRQGFLFWAKKLNWQVIDAEKSLTEVHLLITREVRNKLKLQ